MSRASHFDNSIDMSAALASAYGQLTSPAHHVEVAAIVQGKGGTVVEKRDGISYCLKEEGGRIGEGVDTYLFKAAARRQRSYHRCRFFFFLFFDFLIFLLFFVF